MKLIPNEEWSIMKLYTGNSFEKKHVYAWSLRFFSAGKFKFTRTLVQMHLIPNWLQWRDGPLSKQPLQAAEEALKEAKAFTASRNEEPPRQGPSYRFSKRVGICGWVGPCLCADVKVASGRKLCWPHNQVTFPFNMRCCLLSSAGTGCQTLDDSRL